VLILTRTKLSNTSTRDCVITILTQTEPQVQFLHILTSTFCFHDFLNLDILIGV
jgi:hypothetical protein